MWARGRRLCYHSLWCLSQRFFALSFCLQGVCDKKLRVTFKRHCQTYVLRGYCRCQDQAVPNISWWDTIIFFSDTHTHAQPWLLSCNKRPVNGMHGPQPEDNVIIVCGVYAKDFFCAIISSPGSTSITTTQDTASNAWHRINVCVLSLKPLCDISHPTFNIN